MAMEMPQLINGRTQLLAILADPIVQVKTPELINAELHARGQSGEWILVPWHVTLADLAVAVNGLRQLRNFSGAVITMPHKRAIIEHLDAVSDNALRIGACNVIRRSPDGLLVGDNLDGEGLMTSLRRAGYQVAGKRVLLVGAGGAAASIADSLLHAGVGALSIFNRAESRARDLVFHLQQSGRHPVTFCRGKPTDIDILINATSLGMNPLDPLPVPIEWLQGDMQIVDIVISAQTTPLLCAAREMGCDTHAGVEMLKAQIGLLLDFMLGNDPVSI